MIGKCEVCDSRYTKKHANAKYCKTCRMELRKTPDHNLEKWQTEIIDQMAGLFNRVEIEQAICCSRSSLSRYTRSVNTKLKIPKYSTEVINEVYEYYVKHGKRKVIEKYPNIAIRSIIEHRMKRGLFPRQSPWNEKQLLDLVKMAGLVPAAKQALYFKRPGANVGSIKSAWCKKFGLAQKHVNGLHGSKAKFIINGNCPYIEPHTYIGSKLYLWVDIIDYLKPGLSKDIHLLVQTGVDFQKWLWGGGDVKKKILSFIKKVNKVK